MRALDGLRLLDLSHMLSGPYCSLLLSDLGVETLKIEPPGSGEKTRQLLSTDPDHSVEGVGAYFLSLNRNKKSIALDLKSRRGQEVFHGLVEQSDIVLSNFAVGVANRLGADADTLANVNPRIVTCSISGFGETGPNRDQVSFDLVAQGLGGGMSITGEPTGPPLRAGLPIGDLGAGLMATVGILAALRARDVTGVGQHVDISMQDTQVSLLNYVATMHLMSNKIPVAHGNAHPVHVPYNTFRASDGWFIVAVIFDEFWGQLMTLVDLPELDTPENRAQPGRLANRQIIETALARVFETQPREVWLEQLRAARIPCAPVNDVSQALTDPQIRARNMIVNVPDGSGNTVQMPGNPVKLSGTSKETFSAPPRLGEHSQQVLTEWLGMSLAEVEQLRLNGVI